MADVTPDWDIPYSEGADAVNTVDETMQALAERLDELATLHGRHAAGVTPNMVLAAAGTATTNVVFPVGRFTAAPVVVCNIITGNPATGAGAPANNSSAWASGITAAGCTVNYRRGAADTGVVAWQAVQA